VMAHYVLGSGIMIKALFALALVSIGCSAGAESEQPADELMQAADVPAPPPSIYERACGCADMVEYTIPANGCFAIAYGIWGSIEDDIACFDLTPGDSCTRTCTGYFEAKNPTNAPIKILAFDKLTQSKPGQAQPGVMTQAVEQCDRMFNGPKLTPPEDSYKNFDPFVTQPSGLLTRSEGGPTATTFPSPGKSVCP
jgi:hypothetical protein